MPGLLDDLIACYRFDGDLTDSSGQGNDLSGLSQYTTGKLGQGLTGVYTVDCATFDGFTETIADQQFTVAFWCKSSSADGLGGAISFYHTGDPWLLIYFTTQGNDAHALAVEYEGVSAGLNGTDFLAENTWAHVAIVKAAGSRIYLYRNGVAIDNEAVSGSATSLLPSLHLDVLPIRDDPFVLDQLMVWDRALNASDILSVYGLATGGIGATVPRHRLTAAVPEHSIRAAVPRHRLTASVPRR